MMDERTAYCLGAELAFARTKFPSNEFKLAALMEEVGELAQAMIDHARGKKTKAQVYEEAIQVAAMAIRVAEEGDAAFPYKFDHGCYQAFNVNKVVAA